jgi:hypothetical protein
MTQPERSCRATRWHPHPQKNRPNRSVEAIASRKKTNPAFTRPSSRVYMDSEGSTGERERPAVM